MHLTLRDVRDPIVSSKSITHLHSGIEKRLSRTEVQRSTFARFLWLVNFRPLQQYPPEADIPAKSAFDQSGHWLLFRDKRHQDQSGRPALRSPLASLARSPDR